MPRKHSYLTCTDQFCGAGGSSQGATKAGIEVKLAMAFDKDYIILGYEKDN